MKVKLIFSPDGKTVQFQFSKNEKSLPFTSKESALQGLSYYYRLNKITEKQLRNFFEKISLAENLPFQDQPVFIIISFISSEDEKYTIEEPMVEMCTNQKIPIPQAHIYDAHGKTIGNPFFFKSDGHMLVETLLEYEYITDVDSARLNTLIDILPLPEDVSLN